MKKRKKQMKKLTQIDLIQAVRKPLPRPTMIERVKKKEDKNWNWQDEVEDNDEDMKLPWED